MTGKSDAAYLTIGELSAELGVPQHVLRYWETRFPQLRPVTRAGNRRYYRPEDVGLARRIHGLLNTQGYTVKGVQKLLSGRSGEDEGGPSSGTTPSSAPALAELQAIRILLADALSAG